MGRIAGAIDSDVEEKLISIAEKREKRLQEVGGTEYEEVLKKKDLFNEMNTVWNRRRKVSYQTLPYLLDYAGISIKEMYKLFDIELDWPSESAKNCYNSLKELEKAHQVYLLEIVKAIGTSLWYAPQPEDQEMMTTPTKRAIWVLKRRIDNANDQQSKIAKSLGDEFFKAWSDKKFFTTVSMKSLPAIANRLPVSLHWLFGNDKSIVVLADTPLEEQIMSGYLFLTPAEKHIAEEYIKLIRKEPQNDLL